MDWHHGPAHKLTENGAYIVTAGTYLKQRFFANDKRLELVQTTLFDLANELGWQLQAWAIMSNHYHFVAMSPDDATSLPALVRRLHSITAIKMNADDRTSGRRVWYQYWDTHLTFEKSYLARLNYVHQNPVKHRLVARAQDYRYCSALWFEQNATAPFHKAVSELRTDRVNVFDDFAP